MLFHSQYYLMASVSPKNYPSLRFHLGIAIVTENMSITRDEYRRNRISFNSRLSSPHIFCQNIKALNRYRPMNPHLSACEEKKWVRIRGSTHSCIYHGRDLVHGLGDSRPLHWLGWGGGGKTLIPAFVGENANKLCDRSLAPPKIQPFSCLPIVT